MGCPFCNFKERVLFENELALAFLDNHPVSRGHSLVIPKRHAVTYFDLNSQEIAAIFELSQKVKGYVDELYHPDGYNVGFNVLHAGGQSVMHAHLHIIPRYNGDAEHPHGGIRKVVKHN